MSDLNPELVKLASRLHGLMTERQRPTEREILTNVVAFVGPLFDRIAELEKKLVEHHCMTTPVQWLPSASDQEDRS